MLKLGDPMSIVPSSHVELARIRRELRKAFDVRGWDKIRALDQQLADRLNDAFDDELRDTRLLIKELEKILHIYSLVVAELPQFSLISQLTPRV